MNAELERDGEPVAVAVLYHIDARYPQMWQAAPQRARTSLRNTIKSEVAHYVQGLVQELKRRDMLIAAMREAADADMLRKRIRDLEGQLEQSG